MSEHPEEQIFMLTIDLSNMSVLGYHCTDCGYQHECDTTENGERMCPECGVWVSGVTGERRRGKEISGNITWLVTFGNEARPSETVEAHDVEQAVEKAGEKNDRHISKVEPK